MSKFITVNILNRETIKDLSDLEKKQLPYVCAKTLTDVAIGAQGEIKKQMPSRFTLRSRWATQGVRIEPAKKADIKQHGFCEAVVKHIDPYMTKQEEGGTRRLASHGKESNKTVAVVASGVKRNSSGSVPVPTKKALHLLSKSAKSEIKKVKRKHGRHRKPKPFIIPRKGEQRSKTVIAIRTEQDRYPLKYLFVLSPRPQMHMRYDFRETVIKYTQGKIEKRFAENLLAAMGTAVGHEKAQRTRA